MGRVHALALAVVACFTATTHVSAQSTARDILRQGMDARGYQATYEGRENSLEDAQGRFDGLQVSEGRAWVPAGNAGSYLMIIRNTTSQAYCFWPKLSLSPADWTVSKRDQRSSVEPGAHEVLMVANVSPNVAMQTRYALAYWKPDEARPRGSQCAASEPAGLQEWLATSNSGDFRGSVR